MESKTTQGRISPLLSVCQVTSPLERKGPSSYPSGYVCDPEEVTALTPERNGRKCVKVREEPGAVPGRQHTLGYTAHPSYHKSLLIPIVKTRRDSEVTFLLEATPLISNEVKIQAKPFWLHTTSI